MHESQEHLGMQEHRKNRVQMQGTQGHRGKTGHLKMQESEGCRTPETGPAEDAGTFSGDAGCKMQGHRDAGSAPEEQNLECREPEEMQEHPKEETRNAGTLGNAGRRKNRTCRS